MRLPVQGPLDFVEKVLGPLVAFVQVQSLGQEAGVHLLRFHWNPRGSRLGSLLRGLLYRAAVQLLLGHLADDVLEDLILRVPVRDREPGLDRSLPEHLRGCLVQRPLDVRVDFQGDDFLGGDGLVSEESTQPCGGPLLLTEPCLQLLGLSHEPAPVRRGHVPSQVSLDVGQLLLVEGDVVLQAPDALLRSDPPGRDVVGDLLQGTLRGAVRQLDPRPSPGVLEHLLPGSVVHGGVNAGPRDRGPGLIGLVHDGLGEPYRLPVLDHGVARANDLYRRPFPDSATSRLVLGWIEPGDLPGRAKLRDALSLQEAVHLSLGPNPVTGLEGFPDWVEVSTDTSTCLHRVQASLKGPVTGLVVDELVQLSPSLTEPSGPVNGGLAVPGLLFPVSGRFEGGLNPKNRNGLSPKGDGLAGAEGVEVQLPLQQQLVLVQGPPAQVQCPHSGWDGDLQYHPRVLADPGGGEPGGGVLVQGRGDVAGVGPLEPGQVCRALVFWPEHSVAGAQATVDGDGFRGTGVSHHSVKGFGTWVVSVPEFLVESREPAAYVVGNLCIVGVRDTRVRVPLREGVDGLDADLLGHCRLDCLGGEGFWRTDALVLVAFNEYFVTRCSLAVERDLGRPLGGTKGLTPTTVPVHELLAGTFVDNATYYGYLTRHLPNSQIPALDLSLRDHPHLLNVLDIGDVDLPSSGFTHAGLTDHCL